MRWGTRNVLDGCVYHYFGLSRWSPRFCIWPRICSTFADYWKVTKTPRQLSVAVKRFWGHQRLCRRQNKLRNQGKKITTQIFVAVSRSFCVADSPDTALGSFYTATNMDEFRRIQSRNSFEFVDLFLTPLNFTEFSRCSPLNSPEFRKIPQNRVCIEWPWKIVIVECEWWSEFEWNGYNWNEQCVAALK